MSWIAFAEFPRGKYQNHPELGMKVFAPTMKSAFVHADVKSGRIYWHSPQLDRRLTASLGSNAADSITVRIPTVQKLPGTAPDLVVTLDRIYLLLGTREFVSADAESFAESLVHLPDQEALYQACHERSDRLRLNKIRDLFRERKLDKARPLAEAVLKDPDSTIETKFWAQIQLEGIDFTETVHAGNLRANCRNSSWHTQSHCRRLQPMVRSL